MISDHDSRNRPTRWGKGLPIAAAIGFLLFLILQIVIPMTQANTESEAKPLLDKQGAAAKASDAYHQLMGKSGKETPAITQAESNHIEHKVIYYTHELLSGYISKEKLQASYKPWEKIAPYDVYRVFIYHGEAARSNTSIDIHMTTGQMVGYRSEPSQPLQAASSMSTEERLRRSDEAVQMLGYDLVQVVREPQSEESVQDIHYRVPAAVMGKASLYITVKWSQDQLASVTSDWSIPEDYVMLMEKQDRAANAIQTYGYMVVSLLFGLISFILSLVYRKKIRFRSVTMWVLTTISCSISILHVLNAIPSAAMLSLSRAVSFDRLLFPILLQMAITLIQGGVTLYFSLVTGKWLWQRSPYPALMPTWSDAGFGDRLVKAFWRGLAFAGILLGLQSIIFTALEFSVQAWSSTDAENSPLNLSIPAFFPLVAWVAAISEETFFRLFGVGLLRKLVKNTWIAAILPTFVWAAGHVTYPIYPYYSRPIELMILGFLFVWIMVRFDFWTALFAHLMLDTLLMVISYLLEGSLEGIMIGAIYLFLPIVLVYAIRHFKNNKNNGGANLQPRL